MLFPPKLDPRKPLFFWICLWVGIRSQTPFSPSASGLGVYADYAAGTDPHLFPIDQFIDPLG